MALAKGFRRQQMERLRTLLAADTTLTGLWYGSIVLYPIKEPFVDTESNPNYLPTLAIYCGRENMAFATTESDKRPGAFVMAMLFPEPESSTVSVSLGPQKIADAVYDSAELIITALRKLKRDPTANPGLWHKLIFGGDAKGADDLGMPVGSYSVTYEREPGIMQAFYISFFLAANVANDN